MKLKILSWNIWHGKHLDKIVSYLKSQNADIIGLQEVREDKSGNIAEKIAKSLNYNFVYAKASTNDRSKDKFDLGNAILSRFDIEHSQIFPLSGLDLYQANPETEPRIALKLKISLGDQEITVVTTHLAYSDHFAPSNIRNLQLDNLVKILSGVQILMGDFNSPPESEVVKKIESIMLSTDPSKKPTWTMYPFHFPGFSETKLKHRLDYIFVSRKTKVLKFSVGKSLGSDHLPIITSIEL